MQSDWDRVHFVFALHGTREFGGFQVQQFCTYQLKARLVT